MAAAVGYEGRRAVMRRGAGLAVVVALACGGLLPAPTLGHGGSAAYGIEVRDYLVKTRYGRIYVEVAHPVNAAGKLVKGPAIFTYSPYSILGLPPHYRRNNDMERWVPRGYVRVWADVVGTGNSGGCYDYGGRREKRTGHRLVEWIASRRWSTGKVGMFGGSYEGTTATATAVTRPPHLTTIVPEAAIVRWYDYAYSGGIRYFLNNEEPADEGVDTPLAFDFGLSMPPPTDAEDPAWGERVAARVNPCEKIQHTNHGYDDTPDYGKFWRKRDYLRLADRVRIPVLVSHNWGDWNVKQEEAYKLYRALDNSRNRKLFMGTRWEGHGTPGGEGTLYYRTVGRWFDHYLMGVDNGIEDMAAVHSRRASYEGTDRLYSGRRPRTKPVRLILQNRYGRNGYLWKLLPIEPRVRKDSPKARFRSTGSNTEAGANSDPRRNAQWFWFETPPLRRNVRIFGSIKVRLWSTVFRRWITYTPTIVDYVHGSTNPHGPISVTRGWLDSRYRKTLRRRHQVEPGKRFGMTIVEKPMDYTFKKGHRIGLNIQTEITEWSVPKEYEDCERPSCNVVKINWQRGRSRVVLPVVRPPKNHRRLFVYKFRRRY